MRPKAPRNSESCPMGGLEVGRQDVDIGWTVIQFPNLRRLQTYTQSRARARQGCQPWTLDGPQLNVSRSSYISRREHRSRSKPVDVSHTRGAVEDE